jgi:hypothetical protein
VCGRESGHYTYRWANVTPAAFRGSKDRRSDRGGGSAFEASRSFSDLLRERRMTDNAEPAPPEELDNPPYLSTLLSILVAWANPICASSWTPKQVAECSSTPEEQLELSYLRQNHRLHIYQTQGDGIYLEETMWTLRGKLRWSIAVVIFGGALLAAIGAIWLR